MHIILGVKQNNMTGSSIFIKKKVKRIFKIKIMKNIMNNESKAKEKVYHLGNGIEKHEFVSA